MPEKYSDWQGACRPPANVALVTPSDSTDLAFVTRAVSFSAAGALKVTTENGQTVVIPSGALAAGVQHAMRVTRIWSTGTGATDIVAWY